MDWQDLARSQAGAIARHQLISTGLSLNQVRGLVERREFRLLLPDVYAPRSVPDSFLHRAWGAVLWSDGVISHQSAAQLWDLPVPPSRRIHVTVEHDHHLIAPNWIRVHRPRMPPTATTEIGLLPVTNRSTTCIELLRSLAFGAARDLLDSGVRQGWLDTGHLVAALRDGPGRTGNRQLRRLIAGVEPGAQAESERRMHRLLRNAGITGWVPQYRVRLPTTHAFIDVAFPELKLAIEIDGRRPHGKDSAQFESDRTRQNELQALGWRVLRFTWRMLIDHPDEVVATITRFLAESASIGVVRAV